MRIGSIAIFRFRVPLTRPLRLLGGEMVTREGLLIQIENELGQNGWGEIAPFPGLHRESLRSCEAQLLRLRKALPGAALPEGLSACRGAFGDWLGAHSLFPAVRFGIETALLQLLATSRGQSLAHLLEAHPRERISLNGLLSGAAEELEQQLALLIEEGYRAVKVKVGQLPVEREIERVWRIREALPEDVTLRLDANRAWSLKTALRFGRDLRNCDIDYIEEPLRNSTELETFYAETGMPLALDETLSETDRRNLPALAGVTALILKPAVLGGIENALQWARQAASRGQVGVISSVFDSGVGLSTLAQLAAVVNKRDVPAGLATYQWLAEDLLDPPFSATRGEIALADLAAGQQRLIREKLERVA